MSSERELSADKEPDQWKIEREVANDGSFVLILSHESATEPLHAVQVRRVLMTELQDLKQQGKLDIHDGQLYSVQQVVSELVGNAVIHANRITSVVVIYSAESHQLDLIVENPVPSGEIVAHRSEDPDEGGRGLEAVDSMTDSFDQGVGSKGQIIAHAVFSNVSTYQEPNNEFTPSQAA
jgi:anti-sigma regulatory factor (Ser/Thr protein kinase)